MQRGWLFIVVVLVTGTLAACGEHETGTEAGDNTADTPTSAESVGDFPDQDPREIAAELTQAHWDSDYLLAYDRLVSEFHLLEPDEFWLTRLLDMHILIFEPHGGAIDIEAPVDIDDWEVEEHADFVVVRDRELPINALVLRAEEGKWRWDPGDRGLGQSWHHSLPDGVRENRGWTVNQIQGAHIDYSIDLPEPEVLFALNAFLPITLVMRDDGPELTLGLSISSGMLRNGTETRRPFDHLAHDTLIDLDGVTWRAGDESGPVEIVWTDARVEDNSLVLPGSTEMGQEVPYFDQEYSVTFRLLDFPNDADEAEMAIDEILIGPFGEEVPEYQDEPYPVSVEFSFPIETSADILLGNLPEVEVPDSPEAGEPTPHDELPSNTLDVAFEVQSVEYDQRDDAVHVDLVIDTGGVLPEQPGGDILLTWDDGYQSEIRLLFDDGTIQLSDERNEPPFDAEVIEVTFIDLMVRALDEDENATLHADRIETKWGEFPILDIVEDNDRAMVFYQPAGRRWPQSVEFEHEGQTITLAGGQNLRPDYQPHPDQMIGDVELLDILDELPLPAKVGGAQVDVDATMTID